MPYRVDKHDDDGNREDDCDDSANCHTWDGADVQALDERNHGSCSNHPRHAKVDRKYVGTFDLPWLEDDLRTKEGDFNDEKDDDLS